VKDLAGTEGHPLLLVLKAVYPAAIIVDAFKLLCNMVNKHPSLYLDDTYIICISYRAG
jgi:hypothetical protein